MQISRIRASASRPRRSTSTATETLSTESRLTADRRGTGSASGSRTTSLASPRMVVVHGPTRARRRRGIAASRERTTTGRRPMSGSSHHHTSPRAGSGFMTCSPRVATTSGHPTHRVRRQDADRRLRSSRPPRRSDGAPRARRGLRRGGLRPSGRSEVGERHPVDRRRRWYSPVCETCHKYATKALESRALILHSGRQNAREMRRRRSLNVRLRRSQDHDRLGAEHRGGHLNMTSLCRVQSRVDNRGRA